MKGAKMIFKDNIIAVTLLKIDTKMQVYHVELTADEDEDTEYKYVIPWDLFLPAGENIDLKKHGDQHLGEHTFAKVEEINQGVVILNRTAALAEKAEDFNKTAQVGDYIKATYKSVVYKGDRPIGLYVDYNGVKGYLPAANIVGRQIEDKIYYPNEAIEGYIYSINKTRNQFILTQVAENRHMETESLEMNKIYLGKLVSINENYHIFDCDSRTVVVRNDTVKSPVKLKSRLRVYIFNMRKGNDQTIYYGLIAT